MEEIKTNKLGIELIAKERKRQIEEEVILGDMTTKKPLTRLVMRLLCMLLQLH